MATGPRNPDKRDMPRIIEDAEEGAHGRLRDPGAPPEVGPIERGPVDAGPTGERQGGYREPESANRILWIGGAALVLILVVLGIVYL